MTNQDLQSAVLALREALEDSSYATSCYEESSKLYSYCPCCEAEYDYNNTVKHKPECKLNNALTSTASLAQQIRDEIENTAKVEAERLFSKAIVATQFDNGHRPACDVQELLDTYQQMKDELEGRVKG